MAGLNPAATAAGVNIGQRSWASARSTLTTGLRSRSSPGTGLLMNLQLEDLQVTRLLDGRGHELQGPRWSASIRPGGVGPQQLHRGR